MKFNELQINDNIKNAIDKVGYQETTDIQEKAIPVILSGKDLVARSQTGSGKTLAFGIPIIQGIDLELDTVQSLIICPTRELAQQVADEIRKVTGHMTDISIVCVYGGSDMDRQIRSLKKKPQIVVGTPGRIMDHLRRRTLKLHNLKTFVLDEADEMLNMGFKEDIETILQSVSDKRQTLMFSATFPKSILDIIDKFLKDPVHIEIGISNTSLTNIKQYSLFTRNKLEKLNDLINEHKPKMSIVFCNTQKMTEKVKEQLEESGHVVEALHGGLRQRERTKIMKDVKKSNQMILVATDVAARGIDINDIDIVFNFDLPANVEIYLHRIGRTARAGKSGTSITLINYKGQVSDLKEYEKKTNSKIVEIPSNEAMPKSENSRPDRERGFSRRPRTGFDDGHSDRKRPRRSFDDNADRKRGSAQGDHDDKRISRSRFDDNRDDRRPRRSFDSNKTIDRDTHRPSRFDNNSDDRKTRKEFSGSDRERPRREASGHDRTKPFSRDSRERKIDSDRPFADKPRRFKDKGPRNRALHNDIEILSNESRQRSGDKPDRRSERDFSSHSERHTRHEGRESRESKFEPRELSHKKPQFRDSNKRYGEDKEGSKHFGSKRHDSKDNDRRPRKSFDDNNTGNRPSIRPARFDRLNDVKDNARKSDFSKNRGPRNEEKRDFSTKNKPFNNDKFSAKSNHSKTNNNSERPQKRSPRKSVSKVGRVGKIIF